jgi:hypothetical protein
MNIEQRVAKIVEKIHMLAHSWSEYLEKEAD